MKYLLFVFGLLLAGCSDGLVDADTDLFKDRHLEDAAASKLRNAGHVVMTKGGGGGSGKPGSTTPTATTSLTGTVIVGLEEGVSAFEVMERYSLTYGTKHRRMFRGTAKGFTVDTAGMTDVQKAAWMADMDGDSNIRWYEPEQKMHQASGGTKAMKDFKQSVPKRLRSVGGTSSTAASGDGSGNIDIDVYVLDSGINHPDLNVVERIDFATLADEVTATGLLERFALLQRYSLLERFEWETGEAFDAVGHGTHVAGTIGAIDDDDGLVGVAPGVNLHDFRVLDEQGDGDFGAVIEALEIIIDRKIQNPDTPMVVNLSLGANVGTSAFNGLDEVVAQALGEGIIIVTAAGNEGVDASLVSPAHVPGVITVGSALQLNNGWHISDFSNGGSMIDIWAPGEGVDSLDPFDLGVSNDMTGTSMAAPHVTGAVALILAADPRATVKRVENILKQESHYKIKRAPQGITDLVIDLGRL